MIIVYRDAGPWGSGKGSALTKLEGDTNLHELFTAITEIAENPPEPVSIDHFIVEGSLLTIVLTNGAEHGPFAMPIARWRWTGPWVSDTTYFAGDIISNNGNIFFVRVQHISAATFDPDLFTIDGQVYMLVIAKASQPYDIGMFFNDAILSGERPLMLHISVRVFSIPGDFLGSEAFLLKATTTTPIVLPIYKNDTLIGLLTFTPGDQLVGDGQFGTFSMLGGSPVPDVDFTIRDRLTIAEPYESDATASGLSVTIVGDTPAL